MTKLAKPEIGCFGLFSDLTTSLFCLLCHTHKGRKTLKDAKWKSEIFYTISFRTTGWSDAKIVKKIPLTKYAMTATEEKRRRKRKRK